MLECQQQNDAAATLLYMCKLQAVSLLLAQECLNKSTDSPKSSCRNNQPHPRQVSVQNVQPPVKCRTDWGTGRPVQASSSYL